jgi:hypothetical protein
MFRRILISPLLLLPVALAPLAGCGGSLSADDPRVVEQRVKFLLDTEPDNEKVVLVQDVRERVEASNESDQILVLGKIGGVENPWSKGRAGFVMIDPAVAADHDTENCTDADCPHCKRARERKKLQATALVEFVADGKVVPIDARTLFRLKEGQTVVVRGRAKLNDDNLVIEADGLYVRE